jgi:hypothetical protein
MFPRDMVFLRFISVDILYKGDTEDDDDDYDNNNNNNNNKAKVKNSRMVTSSIITDLLYQRFLSNVTLCEMSRNIRPVPSEIV